MLYRFRRAKILILLAIFIFPAFFGCSSQSDEYTEHVVEFPASNSKKTGYNSAVYEIEPFELHFVLPKGWTVREKTADGKQPLYLYSGAFSRLYLFDTDDTCAGAVGYSTFQLYEGAEDNLQAIYSQIALGNGYRFDLRESYSVAASTDTTETGYMDVYYSKNFMQAFTEDPSERTNKGILSYDKTRLIYVALEFEGSALTDAEWETIAKSITVSSIREK